MSIIVYLIKNSELSINKKDAYYSTNNILRKEVKND